MVVDAELKVKGRDVCVYTRLAREGEAEYQVHLSRNRVVSSQRFHSHAAPFSRNQREP